jgi:hypothetical protein
MRRCLSIKNVFLSDTFVKSHFAIGSVGGPVPGVWGGSQIDCCQAERGAAGRMLDARQLAILAPLVDIRTNKWS